MAGLRIYIEVGVGALDDTFKLLLLRLREHFSVAPHILPTAITAIRMIVTVATIMIDVVRRVSGSRTRIAFTSSNIGVSSDRLSSADFTTVRDWSLKSGPITSSSDICWTIVIDLQ